MSGSLPKVLCPRSTPRPFRGARGLNISLIYRPIVRIREFLSTYTNFISSLVHFSVWSVVPQTLGIALSEFELSS